jgi:hypothetical protein
MAADRNSPEYIEELAERADPDQLWRRNPIDQLELPPDQRMQLDTAVALRRYAHHLRDLRRAREARQSWLITPLGPHGSAVKAIKTPPDHAKLRDARDRADGVGGTDGR